MSGETVHGDDSGHGDAATPGATGSGDHLEYELDDWAVESRQMLRQLLVGADVPHVWEAGRLVVPEVFEDQVDGFVDQVAATFAGTIDDPTVERVAFDVADFADALVDELVAALDTAGIDWLIDVEGLLVVAATDADAVDAIVESLEFPHALPVVEEADLGDGGDGMDDSASDDGVAAAPEIDVDRVLGGLFVAADRLARRATDPRGVLDTLALADELAEGSMPFGFEPTGWSLLTTEVAQLASLLGDDATSDDDLEAAAADLRERLRPWV